MLPCLLNAYSHPDTCLITIFIFFHLTDIYTKPHPFISPLYIFNSQFSGNHVACYFPLYISPLYLSSCMLFFFGHHVVSTLFWNRMSLLQRNSMSCTVKNLTSIQSFFPSFAMLLLSFRKPYAIITAKQYATYYHKRFVVSPSDLPLHLKQRVHCPL